MMDLWLSQRRLWRFLRGGVGKYVTNISKTAVMDVIGFLCVSLGSSTVQLHDSLGNRRACACSDAGLCSQNGERAWGIYYRRAAFCCAFLWAKEFNAYSIHKDMFSAYSGKCLSRKAVQNLVQKFSRSLSKVADNARPIAEVAETRVKRLLFCGFRRTGKAMGQVYQCWWRICREMFFPGSNITCFTFYIHL
jgi:hypothetical protein